MRSLTDTWTMAKRSLRHTTRSLDTIITVVLMPIGILLLFVYVFGGALGKQTGSIDYVECRWLAGWASASNPEIPFVGERQRIAEEWRHVVAPPYFRILRLTCWSHRR